jgi:hypothetical protein
VTFRLWLCTLLYEKFQNRVAEQPPAAVACLENNCEKVAQTPAFNGRELLQRSNDMVIMYVLFFFCGLIGLWALACLVSAMVKSGGPVKLLKKWLQAVTGGS